MAILQESANKLAKKCPSFHVRASAPGFFIFPIPTAMCGMVVLYMRWLASETQLTPRKLEIFGYFYLSIVVLFF